MNILNTIECGTEFVQYCFLYPSVSTVNTHYRSASFILTVISAGSLTYLLLSVGKNEEYM